MVSLELPLFLALVDEIYAETIRLAQSGWAASQRWSLKATHVPQQSGLGQRVELTCSWKEVQQIQWCIYR